MIDYQENGGASKYGGLTNDEIMLIYYRFKGYLDTLEDNLKNRRVSKVIDTPLGKATAIVNVPEEHVEKFKETRYYALTKAVVAKLGPVVELLEECDTDFKKLSDELR